ncbi:MAG: hypothetical protein EOS73_29435 [Mesorhizobium sp.]|uniref:hypothetical protein n=1 Tax=Mesorhizobium sp. M7A.F.Ca.ET.027.02.1.1 TaxID=2496655 RepID=UPI000FD4295B|nr:hypothetical protein [Mesorhizobium sp. M7A.F.Ca.ET.027.02.1.1]RVD14305.1 hypothetical protein EN749_20195 [Mesorhizobium sp. M7A.F.Ca.ET.027.02.1.1]RWC98984.1 MAG: hypothetical protein EOS73_29435 [Mesorhizobium sp.]
MSIWDIHYAALYNSPLAVDAVLTIDGTDGTTIELRAIDKTAPAALAFKGVEVLDIKLAAMVRASDLADIELAALRNATLAFSGRTWTIRSHEIFPAPTGESKGEIRLILSEETE